MQEHGDVLTKASAPKAPTSASSMQTSTRGCVSNTISEAAPCICQEQSACDRDQRNRFRSRFRRCAVSLSVSRSYRDGRFLMQEALSKTQFIRDRVDRLGHDRVGLQLEGQLSIPRFRISLW